MEGEGRYDKDLETPKSDLTTTTSIEAPKSDLTATSEKETEEEKETKSLDYYFSDIRPYFDNENEDDTEKPQIEFDSYAHLKGTTEEDAQVRAGLLDHVRVDVGDTFDSAMLKLRYLRSQGRRAFLIFNGRRFDNYSENNNFEFQEWRKRIKAYRTLDDTSEISVTDKRKLVSVLEDVKQVQNITIETRDEGEQKITNTEKLLNQFGLKFVKSEIHDEGFPAVEYYVFKDEDIEQIVRNVKENMSRSDMSESEHAMLAKELDKLRDMERLSQRDAGRIDGFFRSYCPNSWEESLEEGSNTSIDTLESDYIFFELEREKETKGLDYYFSDIRPYFDDENEDDTEKPQIEFVFEDHLKGTTEEDAQVRAGLLDHVKVYVGDTFDSAMLKLRYLKSQGRRAFLIFNDRRFDNYSENNNFEMEEWRKRIKAYRTLDGTSEISLTDRYRLVSVLQGIKKVQNLTVETRNNGERRIEDTEKLLNQFGLKFIKFETHDEKSPTVEYYVFKDEDVEQIVRNVKEKMSMSRSEMSESEYKKWVRELERLRNMQKLDQKDVKKINTLFSRYCPNSWEELKKKNGNRLEQYI